MKTEEESTDASQLDPGLRDNKNVSQTIPQISPTWLRNLKFALALGVAAWLPIVVAWAFVLDKTGTFSSFPEAFMWCGIGWGGWILFSVIVVAVWRLIVMAINSFKQRHPVLAGYWLMTGYVIGRILIWAFVTSLIGMVPCAIFLRDYNVIGDVLGWTLFVSFIGIFLHVLIFPDECRP
jgi:hypothetical protein